MKTKSFAFLILLVIACWALPALGQVGVADASLKGTITDPNDAVVPGANIMATSIDKGTSRTAKTGTEGTYHIPVLPPGVYRVEVEARGFKPVVNDNLRLTLGQVAVFDVQLSTGTLTAQVAIASDAALIDVERTQQANTISTRQVESLPNVGRSFQNYVYT